MALISVDLSPPIPPSGPFVDVESIALDVGDQLNITSHSILGAPQIFQLISCRMHFVTDANAGNRDLELKLYSAEAGTLNAIMLNNIVASQDVYWLISAYMIFAGDSQLYYPNTTCITPESFIISGNDYIQLYPRDLKAGDVLSGIRFRWKYLNPCLGVYGPYMGSKQYAPANGEPAKQYEITLCESKLLQEMGLC